MKVPKKENDKLEETNKESDDWDLGARQCNVNDDDCESCQ